MANRFFTYEFLAWRTAGRSNGTTRVLVNVTSTGIFADFLKDVPFTLEDGQTKTSGLISIPIHPLDPLPVCKAINLPTKSAPLRVYLTGKTEFTVSLDCKDAVALPRIVSLAEVARSHGESFKCSRPLVQRKSSGGRTRYHDNIRRVKN